uniref:18 kDa Sin3-associated polypeptide n=1 Tax=Microcebus murinus TaxID=30608 RepID=A0A8C5XT24_MICMU
MDGFSCRNIPSSELQVYTWLDATLKELTSLVKEVNPEARKKGTHFNFAIEIGSTMSGRKRTDDSMILQSQKFQIGDYLDIVITPPNRAPPPSGCTRTLLNSIYYFLNLFFGQFCKISLHVLFPPVMIAIKPLNSKQIIMHLFRSLDLDVLCYKY